MTAFSGPSQCKAEIPKGEGPAPEDLFALLTEIPVWEAHDVFPGNHSLCLLIFVDILNNLFTVLDADKALSRCPSSYPHSGSGEQPSRLV